MVGWIRQPAGAHRRPPAGWPLALVLALAVLAIAVLVVTWSAAGRSRSSCRPGDGATLAISGHCAAGAARGASGAADLREPGCSHSNSGYIAAGVENEAWHAMSCTSSKSTRPGQHR